VQEGKTEKKPEIITITTILITPDYVAILTAPGPSHPSGVKSNVCDTLSPLGGSEISLFYYYYIFFLPGLPLLIV